MFVNDIFKKKQLDEGGPFRSTEPKKPRKGSVADLAAQKRKEQERGKQPIEPKDQRVGTAKVVKEFAPGGGGGGRWYSDDQLYEIIGEDWLEAFDVSGDQGNIDLRGERARLFLAQEAEAWLTDRGYRVNVLDVKDDGDSLSWYIQGPLYKGVAEGAYTSQFQSLEDAIVYAKDKVKSLRDPADGIEIYAMPDGGADLVHTMNSNGRRHIIQNGGKKLRTIYANDEQGVAEGSGGTKYKIKSIGKDKNGDYYISPNTGKKVYKQAKVGDHETPRGEVKPKVVEGSAQDKLHKRHQELRKKSGLPDPDYYKELKTTYDLPDEERHAKQKEIKQKYKITNEDREQYIEELQRAGYEIVNEKRMTCPECGGAAYSDRMLAEKQDACYHKVKSRYKVWPSAYASGALVRCRKKGAKNWGNKSKK